MKLNSEKNITLCQKALYSKQLQYYSKLCELYSNLAKLQGPNVTPEKVQEAYAEPLSLATSGDLSFIDDFGFAEYTSEEIDIFKNYSFCAERLNQFKTAANILKKGLIRYPFRNAEINSIAIKEYKNYMKETSKSTRDFDNFTEETSSRLIGHKYYLVTKNSIKKINKIDNTHINSKIFAEKLTPAAFGATISKPKTPKQVRDDATQLYDEDEKAEYSEEPNVVTEATYILGEKAKKSATRFYKANKTAVRTSIAAIMTAAALIGGISYINNVKDYDNLSSNSTEYTSYISRDTHLELEKIRNIIEEYESSTSLPPIEDVMALRNSLDEVINSVMFDLSKSAFEEKNPDCSVISVNTRYDKTIEYHSEYEPENFCTITYIDKDGTEKSICVSDFSSEYAFAKKSIDLSYDNEYALDNVNTKEVYSGTPEQIKEKFENLIEQYKTILEDTEHLAGTKMEFSKILGIAHLKTVTPEEKNKNDDDREH